MGALSKRQCPAQGQLPDDQRDSAQHIPKSTQGEQKRNSRGLCSMQSVSAVNINLVSNRWTATRCLVSRNLAMSYWTTLSCVLDVVVVFVVQEVVVVVVFVVAHSNLLARQCLVVCSLSKFVMIDFVRSVRANCEMYLVVLVHTSRTSV